MGNDATFIGPVNPGKPILYSGGGIPQSMYKGKGKVGASSKKDEDDVNALFRQTSDYDNQKTDFSLKKMAAVSQLRGILKNKYQGDASSFIRDPEVNSIIRGIHGLDALHHANKNAIETEKKNYEAGYKEANLNDAIDNYASGSRGQRYYIDKETGEIREGFNRNADLDDGQDYLRVGEMYDYQRKSLGINNGVAEQGVWVNTIDNKARYFTTELNNRIKEVAAKKHESGSSSGLRGSGVSSFLISSDSLNSSNVKNIKEGVAAISAKLSKEAKLDAKNQYWEEGGDYGVMVRTQGRNGGLFTISKEDYERIKSGDIRDDEREIFNAEKISDEERFDIWLGYKANAMAQGMENVINHKYDKYHKLTEAEVGNFYDQKRMTDWDVLTSPKTINSIGNKREKKIYQILKHPKDGEVGISKEFQVSFAELPFDLATQKKFDEWNSAYLDEVTDDEGEIIRDKLKKADKVLGGGHIIINGVILPDKLARKLYFYQYGNTTSTGPAIKNNRWAVDKDGNQKLDPTTGRPSDERSYMQVQYAITDLDVIQEVRDYLTIEHSILTSSDKKTYGNGNSLSYTGKTDVESDYWGVGVSQAGEDMGAFDVDSDGAFAYDTFVFSGLQEVTSTKPLERVGHGPNKGAADIYNQANNNNGANKAKAKINNYRNQMNNGE